MAKFIVTYRSGPDGPEKTIDIVTSSETRAREILGEAEGAGTEILSVREVTEPESSRPGDV